MNRSRLQNLSPSAAGAAEALSSFDTVPAWSIVEQLTQLHPEYAGGKAKGTGFDQALGFA